MLLRNLGFTYVRLPLNSDDWTGDDTRRRHARGALERALLALRQVDLVAMVDFHPSEQLRERAQADPAAASRAVFRAWQHLAPQLQAHSPQMVAAEILNEPPFERHDWLALRDLLIGLVRDICPDHTIVWGADRYQSIGETIGVPPPLDLNTVVAVHYYTPMSFTHQCADWDSSGLARLSNLPFPATAQSPAVRLLREQLRSAGDNEALALLREDFAQPWTAERIEADMRELAGWAASVQTGVVINEFGVLDACVDVRSRAAWVTALRASAEAHAIGWAYWELDQGFGFMSDRQSLEDIELPLLEALLGRTSP